MRIQYVPVVAIFAQLHFKWLNAIHNLLMQTHTTSQLCNNNVLALLNMIGYHYTSYTSQPLER